MLDPLSTLSIPLSDPGLAVPTAAPLPVRKLLSPSPDHPDDYILEIDYSNFSEFLVCPRRFENKVVRSREAAREQTALAKGNLVHKLEELRLLDPVDVQKKQQDAIIEDYVKIPVGAGDFRQQSFIVDVWTKYSKTYANDSWKERVLIVEGKPFIERPFKIELMTVELNTLLPYSKALLVAVNEPADDQGVFIRNLHIVLTGKIDAALELNSTIFAMDTKTTSRGGDEFFRYFNLSFQTRGYAWALQKILNREVMGAIVNAIIWRAPTRTGKGTEFQRPTYFYSQDQLGEWEDSMKAHCETLVSMLVKGFFPQVSLSFRSPCVWCDYEDNCRLPRSQRAADLASNIYRDVTWNPMHAE